MPKSITRTYSRYNRDAVALLGALIREARNECRLTATIEQNWDAVCAKAELNEGDKKLLWKRQFLNPYSVEQ